MYLVSCRLSIQIELQMFGIQTPDLIQYRSGYRLTVRARALNPLRTGNLKLYQSQGLSTFWGLFIFLMKPVLLTVMVANSPH